MISYIVIGTGRSGTGFMSKLLTNNGIKCGHESIFGVTCDLNIYKKKMYNTDLNADSSWLSVPFIDEITKLNDCIKFIHVVRDPIKVIKSFIELDLFNDNNFSSSPYVTLINHYSNLDYTSQIDRVISYYVTWFKKIEGSDINKIVINLENIDYGNLSNFLGVTINPLNEKVNTKVGKKSKIIIESELIKEVKDSPLYSELYEISKKYGYEI